MPVYKETKEEIEKSIHSILHQTLDDFELILILDNPLDKWRIDYLKSLNDKRIKLLINEKNLGIAESLNKGLKVSKGKYIARMDAGDVALSSRLEKQLKYLEENHLDFVGCSVYLYQDNKRRILNYPSSSKILKKMIFHRDLFLHPTFFLKRELYESLNYYTNMPYVEDYDFLLKVVNQGYSIGNIKEPLLECYLNENGLTKKNQAPQWVISEKLKKHYKKSNDQLTKEAIEEYMHSNNYRKDVEKMNAYLRRKELFFKEKGIKKIYYLVSMINGHFIKNVLFRILVGLCNIFYL